MEGKTEEVLFGPYVDAGRIYRAVCGQEIRRNWDCGEAVGELPPLKSSGYLSGERCGDVAVRLFSLSAVGRCLRQPRHTPLIILPPNTQPLAACLYVCVCPCVHKWSTQAQSSRTERV